MLDIWLFHVSWYKLAVCVYSGSQGQSSFVFSILLLFKIVSAVIERISTLSVESLSSMLLQWLQQDIRINVHNGTTYVTLGRQACMHNAAQMMTSCVSVTCGARTVNASPDFGVDSTDNVILWRLF